MSRLQWILAAAEYIFYHVCMRSILALIYQVCAFNVFPHTACSKAGDMTGPLDKIQVCQLCSTLLRKMTYANTFLSLSAALLLKVQMLQNLLSIMVGGNQICDHYAARLSCP